MGERVVLPASFSWPVILCCRRQLLSGKRAPSSKSRSAAKAGLRTSSSLQHILRMVGSMMESRT